MVPKAENGDGELHSNGVEMAEPPSPVEWDDWRRGECVIPALLGRFFDQKQYTDVNFLLSDGSSIQAHKLILSISSSVFEGMFFGPMSDPQKKDFKIEDVKPVGFRRLLQFIYSSHCLSWKLDEPEHWWFVLEAANKYLNIRLVDMIERRLRDSAKKDAGKGTILRHLNMAHRCSFETAVKSVFLDSVVKNTSKLIRSSDWTGLDEVAILKIYEQDFLAATEAELYDGAKNWCLHNSRSGTEATNLFLDKFASRIIPEFISQRDFLTYVANDDFLGQVDVFREWTIRVMIRNAEDNTVRGSYRPLRFLEFYFNPSKGQTAMSPISFNQENAVIDFQHETTKYTACLTTVLASDGKSCGLHLSLKTESTQKVFQGNKPLTFDKPGPKRTKTTLPHLPDIQMPSDEEMQKTARKSALLVAKMKDGSYKSEVMLNLDDTGTSLTRTNMFSGKSADIEYVQVMIVIDARPSLKVSVISHKQFVEHVGVSDVPDRDSLEEADFSREFQFRVDSYTMEAAEREICKTLKLKDCQAWYVSDNNLCRKRGHSGSDNDLSAYLRSDAMYKLISKMNDNISANKGRSRYTGKGGDATDRFQSNLVELQSKYKAPHFWIMLEKEFKDEPDKLVSSVCNYDSVTNKLKYCGTICLQINEESTLKPTKEFFSMILYNSDPNSKVFLRRFLNPKIVTKVTPSDDIEGINNFDIFVIQEGAKIPDGDASAPPVVDYEMFITRKINEFTVVFRQHTEMEDKWVNICLDKTQGVQYVKYKLREALQVPPESRVTLWECMSSENTSSPLPHKKRAFRRPLDHPISDEDRRPVGDWFSNCDDSIKTLYFAL